MTTTTTTKTKAAMIRNRYNQLPHLTQDIVRPDKKDCAVLSQDPPMKISVLKSVRQVYLITCEMLYTYFIHVVDLSPIVRKRYFE